MHTHRMGRRRAWRFAPLLAVLAVLLVLLATPAISYSATGQIQLQTSPQIYTNTWGVGAWFPEDLFVAVTAVGGDLSGVRVEVRVNNVSGDAFRNWLKAMEAFSGAGTAADLHNASLLKLFNITNDSQLEQSLFQFGHAYIDATQRDFVWVYEVDSVPDGHTAIAQVPFTQTSPQQLGCGDSCAFIPDGVTVRATARGSTTQTLTVPTTALSEVARVVNPNLARGQSVGPDPLLTWQYEGFPDAIQVHFARAGAYNPQGYLSNRDWFRNESGGYDVFVQEFEPARAQGRPLSPGRYMWWVSVANLITWDGRTEDIVHYGPFYFTVNPDCDAAQSRTGCVQPAIYTNQPVAFGELRAGLLSEFRPVDTYVVNGTPGQVLWVEHARVTENLAYKVTINAPSGAALRAFATGTGYAAYLLSEGGPHTISVAWTSGRGQYSLMANQSAPLPSGTPTTAALGPGVGQTHMFWTAGDFQNGAMQVSAERVSSGLGGTLEIFGPDGVRKYTRSLNASTTFFPPSGGPTILHTYRTSGEGGVIVQYAGHLPTIIDIAPDVQQHRGWVAQNGFTDRYAFIPTPGQIYTVELLFGATNADDPGSTLSGLTVKVVNLNTGATVKTFTTRDYWETFGFLANSADPLEIQVSSRSGSGAYLINLAANQIVQNSIGANQELQGTLNSDSDRWDYAVTIAPGTYVTFEVKRTSGDAPIEARLINPLTGEVIKKGTPSWLTGSIKFSLEIPDHPLTLVVSHTGYYASTYTALGRASNFTVKTTSYGTEVGIRSFTADRATIPQYACTTLRWDTVGMTGLTLDYTPVSEGTTSQQVCPGYTKTYTLRGALPDGTQASRSVTVTVNTSAPAGIVNFSAAPNPVRSGGQVAFSIRVREVTALSLNGTPLNLSTFQQESPGVYLGTVTRTISQAGTWTLSVTLPNGQTRTKSVYIQVSAAPAPPTSPPPAPPAPSPGGAEPPRPTTPGQAANAPVILEWCTLPPAADPNQSFQLYYKTSNATKVEIFGWRMSNPAEGVWPVYNHDSPEWWVLNVANNTSWTERAIFVDPANLSRTACRQTVPPNLGTGDVQVTLIWETRADLDLYVIEPNGTRIWYQNRQSSTGGQIDRDANYPCSSGSASPVENVFWPTGRAPRGTYKISVNYYSTCGLAPDSVQFHIIVRVNGQVIYDRWRPINRGETIDVFSFVF